MMSNNRLAILAGAVFAGMLLLIVSLVIYATQYTGSQQEAVEVEQPEGEFVGIESGGASTENTPEWILRQRTVRGVVRAVIPILDEYNCGRYAVIVETDEGPEKMVFDHLPVLYPSLEVEIDTYSHQISDATLADSFLWDGPAIGPCSFFPWDEKVIRWKDLN